MLSCVVLGVAAMAWAGGPAEGAPVPPPKEPYRTWYVGSVEALGSKLDRREVDRGGAVWTGPMRSDWGVALAPMPWEDGAVARAALDQGTLACQVDVGRVALVVARLRGNCTPGAAAAYRRKGVLHTVLAPVSLGLGAAALVAGVDAVQARPEGWGVVEQQLGGLMLGIGATAVVLAPVNFVVGGRHLRYARSLDAR